MNDLHDLLERAATAPEPVDTHDVYGCARRSADRLRARRRRRHAGYGVATVAVMIGVTAVLAPHSTPAKIQTSATTTPTSVPGYQGAQRYETVAPVDFDEHGRSQLCFGMVATVLVPSGGHHCPNATRVVGAGNARLLPSGDKTVHYYRFVGTYEPGVLTLTQPPVEVAQPNPAGDLDFPLPCATPAGGWNVRDANKMTFDDYKSADDAAHASADYAASWYAGSTAESVPDSQDKVVVYAFSDHVDEHRAELERLWGGPMCVTNAAHSEKELGGIATQFAQDVAPKLGITVEAWGPDAAHDRAFAQVVVVTPDQQRAITERYGDLLHLEPELTPFNG